MKDDSDSKAATETVPAHEEGIGSDNVPSEEPGERRFEEQVEVSEVVAVDKTKKKVTIQTPTYKNTSSKKQSRQSSSRKFSQCSQGSVRRPQERCDSLSGNRRTRFG